MDIFVFRDMIDNIKLVIFIKGLLNFGSILKLDIRFILL